MFDLRARGDPLHTAGEDGCASVWPQSVTREVAQPIEGGERPFICEALETDWLAGHIGLELPNPRDSTTMVAPPVRPICSAIRRDRISGPRM